MLYAIAEQPRNVNSLAEVVGIRQPAASRHLKVLKEQGLITANRDGSRVIYTLADNRLIQALDLLRDVMFDQFARQADLLKTNQAQEKGE